MKYNSTACQKLISAEKTLFLIYKSKQDAHITEFILSDNCSKYFGRHNHPSSGAQNN